MKCRLRRRRCIARVRFWWMPGFGASQFRQWCGIRRHSLRALTQNVATGCTVMLNRAAADLIAASRAPGATLHDWWSYLMVSAAGGRVLFDAAPVVLYRQHEANALGAPASFPQRALAALRRGPATFMNGFAAERRGAGGSVRADIRYRKRSGGGDRACAGRRCGAALRCAAHAGAATADLARDHAVPRVVHAVFYQVSPGLPRRDMPGHDR